MKQSTLFLLGMALFLFTGCFDSNNATNPVTGENVATGVSTSTCVKGIPNGSKAVIRGTKDTVNLVNGCFDLSGTSTSSKVAARAMALESDTILVFNDTSLFALTIPFAMLGDTFQMVATNLNLTEAKQGQFDSILAVVYDKGHIHERFVKMKKASTNSKVQYHVSMYSPVNGGDYQIHYEFHKADSVWTSELITAERGSEFTNTVADMDSGSVPRIDTSDLFKEYGTTLAHTVKATSIYGIAKVIVDNVEGATFNDTAWGLHKHNVKVIDSAGYHSTAVLWSYVGYNFRKDITDSLMSYDETNTLSVKYYNVNMSIDTMTANITPTALDTNHTAIKFIYGNHTLAYNLNSYIEKSGHYSYNIGIMDNGGFTISTNDKARKTFIY